MLLKEQLLKSLLAAIPDCQAIYCFGSWGTDDYRADSDIDLAVLAPHPLDPVRRWELAQTLAAMAGRDIDLVDLASASTVFRLQIVAHGERLYCAEPLQVDAFEDLVFSSYVRLNEERSGILHDVRKRGSVYGK